MQGIFIYLENEMEETKKLRICRHCGNKTLFEEKGKYDYKDEEYEWNDEQERAMLSAFTEIKYRLLQCQTCNKPTLELEYEWYGRNEDHFEPYDMNSTIVKEVYPSETKLNNIPSLVEKRYKEALKVQHISPNAFAVMAGRTLEAALNDKGVEGKMLGNKLHNLTTSDLIPKQLQEMAKQINKLRVFGAHDVEEDVIEEDVPIILSFVEAILEYLYIAPAKLAAVQSRLDKTSSDKDNNEPKH